LLRPSTQVIHPIIFFFFFLDIELLLRFEYFRPHPSQSLLGSFQSNNTAKMRFQSTVLAIAASLAFVNAQDLSSVPECAVRPLLSKTPSRLPDPKRNQSQWLI
jgi:hypothetical protein